MKKALLILTLACSSLLFGATERQQEIISKMDSFLKNYEQQEAKNSKSENTKALGSVLFDLDDAEDFNFLPSYPCEGDWSEIFPAFIKNELGLDSDTLDVVDDYEYRVIYETAAGSQITVEIFETEEGVAFFRAVQLLTNLNLKNLNAPHILAIAHLDDHYGHLVIAYETLPGSSLFSHHLNSLFTFFQSQKKAQMNLLTDLYYQLGLAMGELFTKTTQMQTLHPNDELYMKECLEHIENKSSNNTALGISVDRLKELYTLYFTALKMTPSKFCYHFDDLDNSDILYDPNTKTISILYPSELLWSMDLNQRSFTPLFIAYYSTFNDIFNSVTWATETEEELAAFKNAFNRGYQDAGCALPTPEEENIYRFFDGLLVLEDAVDEDNLQWLWNQCQ